MRKSLLLLVPFLLHCSALSAEQIWRYDMLVNSKIIGEQTLRHLRSDSGLQLIQTTQVEKKGWFRSFVMQGVSVEELDSKGHSQALQTRVTANGKSWWSQVFPAEKDLRGVGIDLGQLDTARLEQFSTLDVLISSAQPPAAAEIRRRSQAILGDMPRDEKSLLSADAKFVTSLNALPFYLQAAERIPGSLQLLDNEGLQVINSPIIDLGTQSMEIGGKHYTAQHIKVEKADAGTHIWYNTADTGPVLLMIAGKSGKKKFQISLKERQTSTE